MNAKNIFLAAVIICLGAIPVTYVILNFPKTPNLIESEIPKTSSPASSDSDELATIQSVSVTQESDPIEREKEYVPADKTRSVASETPLVEEAIASGNASFGERLKQLPGTRVLETSVEGNDYGEPFAKKRSYLLETPLKYPYVVVVEWGKFDQNGTATKIESSVAQVADHVIVEVKDGVSLPVFFKKLSLKGFSEIQTIDSRTYVVKIPGEVSISKCDEAIQTLSSLSEITATSEPDYLVSVGKIPSDNDFHNLWGLHNTGQTGGKDDVDIDATETWDRGTGSKDVLVAVIDSGVDRSHGDLKNNMWVNPGEIPNNGKDDDGNGYVDDVYGWDFHNNDNNPHDDNAHGTHCAGTIGASGNNRIGVVGVNWEVSMVGLKFIGASGFGYNSDAIKAINYATAIKAKVTSNSWGGGGYSATMKKAIDSAASKDIAFIAAAGNHDGDNDRFPSYPASFDCANVIAVGANDKKGRIASFSCYGKNSVDLFAPGVEILSTVPGNKYDSYQGTSMATPHVAGAYALVASIQPDWKMSQIKDSLLASVDPEAAMKEKCVSGGRLNVFKALSTEPPKEKLIEAYPPTVDFGHLRSGESKSVEGIIRNPGNETTTISEAFVNSGVTRSQDLVGHWTFDGNANDSSGNGNQGTIKGATLGSDRRGQAGQAIELDGVDDQIVIKHSATLNPKDQMTISAWIKFNGYTNGWSPILHKGGKQVSGYKNREYTLWLHQHPYLHFTSAGDNNSQKSYNTSVPKGKWFHFAVSLDRKNHKLVTYLDGKKSLERTDSYSSFNNNNNDLLFGATEETYSNFSNFKGGLDEIRIYDKALSAAEVASIFREDVVSSSLFQFSLVTPVKLAPGESIKTMFTFAGSNEGKYAANVIIVSDAKNNPRLTIPLQVEVSAFPKLVVSPRSHHFGLKPDEIQEEVIRITNEGPGDGKYNVTVVYPGNGGKGSSSLAQNTSPAQSKEEMFSHEHVPGKLIVVFKQGHSSFSNLGQMSSDIVLERKLAQARRPGAATAAFSDFTLALVRYEGNVNLREVAAKLEKDPAVAYAEPDYVVRTTDVPNDPSWSQQWALPKIKAPEAWKVTKGSTLITVAVIDTGIDYKHPDLQGNIWVNPGEIAGNGIDDDGNGFIDDVYGWDFSNNDNDPMDGHNHGTHVAGIIAAATNNGKQVAGVAWQAKLAAIKFLSDGGRGSTSNAIDSIAYATAMGFPISNNSWGGGGYSRSLKAAITKAGEAGQLFCASAGNSSKDNDRSAHYPSSYDCSNIIAVASIDSMDKLASSSCYGPKSVDLAAPGVSILSLVPNGKTARFSGTSMASPHVAGAAALVLSKSPSAGPTELKKKILDAVDPLTSLKGKMVTGGRLNLAKALDGFAPAWLIVNKISGTIAPGQSIDLKVKVDASHMPGTKASGDVVIRSNDPDNPETTVGVTAEIVTDGKHLTVEPAQLKFGETFVGQTMERFVILTNSGTEAVTIKHFVFRSPLFSHRISLPMRLDPGEQRKEPIFFTPSTKGDSSSEALILTDEEGKNTHSLAVSGTGAEPPIIRVEPGFLSAALGFNKQVTKYLEIFNPGGSRLNFTLEGATPPGGKALAFPAIFGMEHYQPLEKGALDSRPGAPILLMGGGPDRHGYSWSDSSDPAGPEHEWTDITKKGKLLSRLSEMDDGFTKITLPFPVKFYGKSHSVAYVSTNGYLTFEEGSIEHGHYPLPSPMMPKALVAPFAMDLNPSRGGKIYHYADSKEVVVQYDRVKDFAGLGEYTFQISLGRDGVIRFHYNKMNGAVNGAVTGIQNGTADVGLLVAYNNGQIKENNSVRISTSPKWLHASETAGVVEPGKSVRIPITIKAGTILTGEYLATLKVISNDPKKPSVEVPVTLKVKATRILVAEPSSINFGEVEVGLSDKKIIVFRNAGNAPITLSSLKTNSNVISARTTLQKIAPGKEVKVEIEFRPTEGKNYSASCEIRSNADNPLVKVQVSGKGLATPKAKWTPRSLQLTVAAGTKVKKTVILDNEGLADLIWWLRNIQSESSKKSSLPKGDEKSESNAASKSDPFEAEHVPGKLIVAFKQGQSSFAHPVQLSSGIVVERKLAQARRPGAASAAFSDLSLALIRYEGKTNLREVAAKLEKDPAVAYVEPDYVVRTTDVPNDPNWSQQWALPKIKAPEAWKVTKGSPTIIVAVIDTGIDYKHPDLKGNIWINPGEIAGNDIDDDGNGFIDDVYGWDFSNNDNDPMDGHKHGTHVAGTIAAATNNGKQVAGVAWHAKLVAIKFLSDGGRGSTSNAIDSIAYATAMGFPISNNSWGGGGYSRSLKAAITKAGEAGQLFCASAGNSSKDNDRSAHYPSSYDCSNVIAVAATDTQDKLAYFSCWGSKSVDLAAPGTSILSLAPNGKTTRLSGTSMATPHVAGAAALLLSQNPMAGPDELKKMLMDSVDSVGSLKGKMVSGGRLNLAKALKGFAPGWLSVSPKSGTVKPGESTEVIFTIDATNLVAGTKKATGIFETNDPLAENIGIPVEITVIGEPLIELDKSTIAFGEVWVGDERKIKIVVTNSGTDQLVISKVSVGHGDFSVTPQTLKLEPGDKGSLELVVRPSTSGLIQETLVISSNAKNEAEAKVSIKVDAQMPPSMRVEPPLVNFSLEPGKKGEASIVGSNLGDAILDFDGTIVFSTKGRSKSSSVDQVLKSLNAPGRATRNGALGVPSEGDQTTFGQFSEITAKRIPGGNAVTGLEVAVLGANTSERQADIAKGLAATKRFAGVTTIDVRRVTPTVDELKAFDAVIAYSNYSYRDYKKLGDALADYADAGGGVVSMAFDTSVKLGSNHALGGRWLKEKYNVFELSKTNKRDRSSIGQIMYPNHPLMNEFNAFKGTYRLNKRSVNQGSTLVAKWKDGTPLAAYRNNPATVVGLNFYPVSNRIISTGWDQKTDGWILMANSLEWSATGSASSWLKANPLKASVAGGKSKTITLSFDASKLTEGDYEAELRFQSNDPKNPYLAVKVNLKVRENQPPVAKPITLSLLEDQSKRFKLLGEDPEKQPISYTILKQPKHGVLSGKSPDLTYEPNPNFNGKDEFTYKVSDGRKDSDPATVSITVQPVNDRPWVKSLDLETLEDVPLEVPFAYGDVDGDPLKLIFSKDPEHGFLWEEKGTWTYFPNPHYNGKDSIAYKVSDGIIESPEAKVSIQLLATNDAPVAKDMKIKAIEDEPVAFDLDAVDVDGEKIRFEIISLPQHGTLTMEDGHCVYLPYPDYNGEDTFIYRAYDSEVRSNEAVVKLTITSKNDRPIIKDAHFKVMEDGKVQIKPVFSDPDGDELTLKVTIDPSFGTLEGNGTEYEYIPNKDFHGEDFFMMVVNDGMLDSNAARITVEVSGTNDAPRFAVSGNNVKASYRETPLSYIMQAKDADGDTLEFTAVSSGNKGECHVSGNELIYYPVRGFTGTDEVTLKVSDGILSDTTKLSLIIREHPNAIPIHLEGNGETQLSVSFLRLMYELNSHLVEKGHRLFKLETTGSALTSLQNDMENRRIGVRLSSEPATDSGLPPREWIESLPDLEGTKFLSFHRQMNDLGEKWMVAPLFLPPFSTDKDVDSKSSSIGEDVNESGNVNGNGGDFREGFSTLSQMVHEGRMKQATKHEDSKGWYKIESFGDCFVAENGWIFQPNLGWCYAVAENTGASWWLYNESIGWIWLNQDHKNSVWSSGKLADGWIYFPGDSFTDTKLFYNYAAKVWQQRE